MSVFHQSFNRRGVNIRLFVCVVIMLESGSCSSCLIQIYSTGSFWSCHSIDHWKAVKLSTSTWDCLSFLFPFSHMLVRSLFFFSIDRFLFPSLLLSCSKLLGWASVLSVFRFHFRSFISRGQSSPLALIRETHSRTTHTHSLSLSFFVQRELSRAVWWTEVWRPASPSSSSTDLSHTNTHIYSYGQVLLTCRRSDSFSVQWWWNCLQWFMSELFS